MIALTNFLAFKYSRDVSSGYTGMMELCQKNLQYVRNTFANYARSFFSNYARKIAKFHDAYEQWRI